jgi:2-polyprenyl-3-methyl-5-hydroxy-6-metoxy-1,4-benzoquinol methylase
MNEATKTSAEADNDTFASTVQYSVMLPGNNRAYGTREYWEERFTREDSYEWLVTFANVKDQLTARFLTPTSQILIVGCGNSPFSTDLYDAGYVHITNIDFSEVVIQAMKERHQEKRPQMKWLVSAPQFNFTKGPACNYSI